LEISTFPHFQIPKLLDRFAVGVEDLDLAQLLQRRTISAAS
jgi:hypothetical protein